MEKNMVKTWWRLIWFENQRDMEGMNQIKNP